MTTSLPFTNGTPTQTDSNGQTPRARRRKRRLSPLVADAARLCVLLGGVGLRSIRTWDAAGKLPRPIKLGTRTVWRVREIKDWLAAGAPDRETWERLKQADGHGVHPRAKGKSR